MKQNLLNHLTPNIGVSVAYSKFAAKKTLQRQPQQMQRITCSLGGKRGRIYSMKQKKKKKG